MNWVQSLQEEADTKKTQEEFVAAQQKICIDKRCQFAHLLTTQEANLFNKEVKPSGYSIIQASGVPGHKAESSIAWCDLTKHPLNPGICTSTLQLRARLMRQTAKYEMEPDFYIYWNLAANRFYGFSFRRDSGIFYDSHLRYTFNVSEESIATILRNYYLGKHLYIDLQVANQCTIHNKVHKSG